MLLKALEQGLKISIISDNFMQQSQTSSDEIQKLAIFATKLTYPRFSEKKSVFLFSELKECLFFGHLTNTEFRTR